MRMFVAGVNNRKTQNSNFRIAKSKMVITDGHNLSALLNAKNDLKVVDTSIPEPKKGHVLVRMGPVGICGSDVHYWQHMQIGHFIVKQPMILGHESAGTSDVIFWLLKPTETP